jgi:hypothetical protein
MKNEITKEFLLNKGFDDFGYGEYEKHGFLLDNEYTDKNEWWVIYKDFKEEIQEFYQNDLIELYFKLTNKQL